VLAGIGEDFLPGRTQQRPEEDFATQARVLRHPARAARPGAAQQIHQHGLGLVVEVVGQRDDLRLVLPESCIARFARRGLQPLSCPADPDTHDFERNPELSAERATKLGPRVRVGAQAVMDVNRGDRAILQLVQQNDRIDAAGERDGNLPNARSLP
jgi:hypothetical protein